MNKKILMFSLLGIFTVMLVTAGIVNYLSNTATANVYVDHAMEVSFANIDSDAFPLTGVSDWNSELTIADTTQLSTILAGVKVENNADVNIEDKYLALTVSNGNDVSCEDITSIQFLDTATETQLAKGFQELSELCVDLGNDVVYNIPINSLASKTTYEYPSKVTFGIVEPTTYTFSGQMVVEPVNSLPN